MQKIWSQTISVLSDAVEARDPYTSGHQKRVAALSVAIAHELGFAEDEITGLRMAAMIHDIGKLKIPGEILTKTGKLIEPEFNLIKTHVEAGCGILKGMDFPWDISKMIHQHHERLDGSGYPDGIRAEEILLEARILAVSDVVEAMSAHRPYRPALGIDAALIEISNNSGKLYDAEVVSACHKLFVDGKFSFPDS